MKSLEFFSLHNSKINKSHLSRPEIFSDSSYANGGWRSSVRRLVLGVTTTVRFVFVSMDTIIGGVSIKLPNDPFVNEVVGGKDFLHRRTIVENLAQLPFTKRWLARVRQRASCNQGDDRHRQKSGGLISSISKQRAFLA